MNIFRNYFQITSTNSALLLLIVRIFFVCYILWKVYSYKFLLLAEWPRFFFETINLQHYLYIGDVFFTFMPLYITALTILSVAVLIGWKLRYTSLLLSILLAYLAAIHYGVSNAASTFIPAVFYLLFVSLFYKSDVFTFDGLKRIYAMYSHDLHTKLAQPQESVYPHEPLTFFSLLIGVIYFLTGFTKLHTSGIAWIHPENLQLILVQFANYLTYLPALSHIILTSTILATTGAAITIFLEIGLIIQLLRKKNITVFVIGILVLHTAIAFTMEIFFFDQYILFALLLPWDAWYTKWQSNNPVIVWYDTRCDFCAKSLIPISLLNINKAITFAPLSKRKDLSQSAMHVQAGTDYYTGYDGFAYLMKHLRIYPVYWCMRLPGVDWLGIKCYAYIAKKRGRLFTCARQDF